jgi:hypothetical protein
MSQAVDILNDIVQEELPRLFVDLEPTIAPVWDRVKRTSMGVKSQDGLGKGYQVIHIYETGTAGLFESGDPLGPGMTDIEGNQAQMLALGTAATNLDIFPSATEVPHTGEVKRTLALHRVVGNYAFPAEWKQLDVLNANQLKKVRRDLKAVAKNKLQYEATSFFSYEVAAHGGASGQVCQVLGRIASIGEHSKWEDNILITLDEQYGRIANFVKGQSIDIVADYTGYDQIEVGTAVTGADVRNYTHTDQDYVRLIVVDVDYLGKKITLKPINTVSGAMPNYGHGTSGDVFQASYPAAANDWLVYAKTSRYTGGSRPQYSWGINNWVKASGTILGGAAEASGLDIDLYSMFKSQVKAVNGPLTDDVINGYIAGYLDAYPGETLDTIITTQGVQQKWLQQPGLYNNRQNYDRTGKAVSFTGGWSKISYEFGGRVFEWIVSPMCLSKTLYGMKFGGNNILRYGPPRIGGTDASMGPELEFLATLGEGKSVFMVARDSSSARPTTLIEAPFWYYNLMAPRDPRGLKLTDLTEATML